MWVTYAARSDKTGRTVLVEVDYDDPDAESGGTGPASLGPARQLRARDGRPLRVMRKGVYRLASGEIIRCTDPNAP